MITEKQTEIQQIHHEMKEILADKRIAIVSHTFTSGPGQELEKYLIKHCKEVVFIGYPFYYSASSRTFYRVTAEGKTVERQSIIPHRNKFGSMNLGAFTMLQHLSDFLTTIFYFIKYRRKFDLIIGVDGLNAFSGLWLKKMRVTDKVVFYVIDYIPNKFANKMLNNLYHWVDRHCVRKCDSVWNLDQAMAEERMKFGITQDNSAPQIVVPIGTNYANIERHEISEIDRYRLVIVSALMKKQGIQLVLESLPEVIKQVPKTRLLIIGKGDYEAELRRLVQEKEIGEHVEFRVVEDNAELERILTKCAIGLAPYLPDDTNYARFTDVGKPKLYAACGLPVIITRVPKVALEIEKMNAGVVIEYRKDEMVKGLLQLLTDDKDYSVKRKNAAEFAEKYDWENVFARALHSVLKQRPNS